MKQSSMEGTICLRVCFFVLLIINQCQSSAGQAQQDNNTTRAEPATPVVVHLEDEPPPPPPPVDDKRNPDGYYLTEEMGQFSPYYLDEENSRQLISWRQVSGANGRPKLETRLVDISGLQPVCYLPHLVARQTPQDTAQVVERPGRRVIKSLIASGAKRRRQVQQRPHQELCNRQLDLDHNRLWNSLQESHEQQQQPPRKSIKILRKCQLADFGRSADRSGGGGGGGEQERPIVVATRYFIKTPEWNLSLINATIAAYDRFESKSELETTAAAGKLNVVPANNNQTGESYLAGQQQQQQQHQQPRMIVAQVLSRKIQELVETNNNRNGQQVGALARA